MIYKCSSKVTAYEAKSLHRQLISHNKEQHVMGCAVTAKESTPAHKHPHYNPLTARVTVRTLLVCPLWSKTFVSACLNKHFELELYSL